MNKCFPWLENLRISKDARNGVGQLIEKEIVKVSGFLSNQQCSHWKSFPSVEQLTISNNGRQVSQFIILFGDCG